MPAKLKPCPFCGKSIARIARYESAIGMTYHVWCVYCGACASEENSKKKAVNAWNRRTNDERND